MTEHPAPRERNQPPGNLASALAAYSRGEPEARDRLLIACRARIEKLAHWLLGSHPEIRRGAHDTEDILQDACVKLWRAIESEQPESERHLHALAAMQVRRIVIDLTRKFGGPRSPVKNQATNVVPRGSRTIDRTDEAAEVAEDFDTTDMSHFHDEVAKLNAELREVFEHRFYLGGSVEDVARCVGCDPRTVKRRWKLAKEQLQARLEPHTKGINRSPD